MPPPFADDSDADDIHPPRDLLRRDQVALPGAGADLTRRLPRLRRDDVALPERPGAALARARRVDGTPGGLVVEHAVAVGLLAERPPPAGQPRVEPRDLLDRFAAELGEGGDFLIRDPDEARLARAALAAAGAAKPQAVLIPYL